MTLTVSDLIGMPHLRLELAAGDAGIDTPVTWAHSSDLDTPWQWLTGGELLMKNGRTLPRSASRQASFLTSLADADISGMVIGLDPQTPALSAGAIAVADERRLPVVFAPYSVGFAAIGRAVADANIRNEARRTALTERVYNAVRTAVVKQARDGTLRNLASDLACRLAVLDAETGDVALDGTDRLPGELRTSALAAVARHEGRLPGVVRLDAGGHLGLAVEVPDEEPTVLVAYDFRSAVPDIGLLQHVATAVAVLLAHQGLRRELERRVGGELLAHLLDRRLQDAAGAAQLAERGLVLDRCAIVAAIGGTAQAQQQLHVGLARRGTANLLLRRSDVLYAMLEPTADALASIRRRLGADVLLGVSDVLASTDRIPGAAREAVWAARASASSPEHLAHYGDAPVLSVLRDADEALTVVDRTLRALLTYDTEHDSELVHTLDTFLRCERSWQRAAGVLGIHKQTLVYRIRRVEEITGRRLTDTGDISQLWLALRAHDLVDIQL